jgi:methionyl-tRNA formyltransferase
LRDRAIREQLESLQPDLLVVVAYGRILPGRVLRAAPRGAVNVHFSLLPRYRGAAPVQWALANGDEVTGVTTMQITPRLDEGDVLMQREVPVEPGEHAPALSDRLAVVGAELLDETLRRLQAGTLEPVSQDDARASLAPLLSRADGEVDLNLSAREIEGRIRGFDPWPGVWVGRRGKRLRLLEARRMEGARPEELAGQVIEMAPPGLVLVCGGGTLLRLLRLQPEGRRAMSVAEAVNGRQLEAGDRLETLRADD